MSEQGGTWDAIAIGSGLGGLAAAAGLAKAGKRVLVIERLGNFGGAATNYRHGALTMEASLHETDGETIGSPHGVFAQLELKDALEAVESEIFYEVRSRLFSAPVRVPHGIDSAKYALQGAFPHVREGLADYFTALSRLHHTFADLEEIGARGLSPILDLVFSGRAFELFQEISHTTKQALDRFFGAEEAVKLALSPHLLYFDDDPAKLSFLVFAGVTARFLEGGSFYFRGGSRALTMALVKRIKEAGGAALHQRTAEAILLDPEGRAAGVRHRGADFFAREDLAPVVFGNAAPAMLAEMLPEAKRGDFLARYAAYEPSISLFTVSLGLSRPARDFGVSAYSTFLYPDWMERLDQYPVAGDVFGGAPGAAMPFYGLADYSSIDAGLAREGDLYLLSLTGVDRLWAWEGLSPEEDKSRRERWMDAFVADLERRYPGVAGAVAQREMATARTMKNRLGSPHGEVYGFRPTPQRLFHNAAGPRTSVPGLWLASAYTVAGGFSGALQGGLIAAQAALSDLRRHGRRRAQA
jgi:phytoene dehydrogenase-like protein